MLWGQGEREDLEMKDIASVQKPSFREAFLFWSKLGWISFGGTAGHLAIMHDSLVEKKKWISNGKFLHALSHCMILPGPEATQLAIYIGWQLHGKKGGLAAGILFVLPSMFILLALSIVYVLFGDLPWISAMFSGLKPAVIALIVIALFKVAEKALRGPLHVMVAAIAFVTMFFFNVSLLLIMAGAVVLAIAIGYLRPSLFHNKNATHEEEEEEQGYYINRYSTEPESGFEIKAILKLFAGTLLLWLLPFPLFYFFAGDFHFWKSLSLFFTKTAFVTIGGSYTVIPYVAQLGVTKLHWLSRLQMMDGFALAETTPGPLIIVLAFVGFMAGYNHFHASIWMGTIGLLATTFYTFLPCFLFVFAGAPVVEQTQGKPVVEGVLGVITAVVVGAILDLTLFLGKGVVFPAGAAVLRGIDVIAVGWVILSVVLLKKFKWNVISLVMLSVLFGLVRYFVQLSLR
jgi:chromate transporter